MAPPAWAPPGKDVRHRQRAAMASDPLRGVDEVFVQRLSPMRRRGAGAAQAMSARIAFAPSRLRLGVPSSAAKLLVDAALILSVPAVKRAGDLVRRRRRRRGARCAPRNRPLSPSRSSCASWRPVEAPEGALARPSDPSSSMDIGLDCRAAAGIENLARRDARYPGSRHECDSRRLRTRNSGSAEGFSIMAEATPLGGRRCRGPQIVDGRIALEPRKDQAADEPDEFAASITGGPSSR